MFSFDILNNPEPFSLYLCKPNGDVVCQLNGIDENSASITMNLNNQHELSFDYLRYISSNGELIESNGYHNLVIGMKILIDHIGYFKMQYSPMEFDGDKETKRVTASSVECELESKDLINFKINTGESDSLEYLVTYDDDESESLINVYTGLPYDYIVFYNTYPEQLSNLFNKYSDGIYTDTAIIEEIKFYCDLIPRLKNKVTTDNDGEMSLTEFVEYTYDDTGDHIISIHLSGFNERISQLISFYERYHDQLSLLSLAIEKCNCNWSIGTIDNSLVNKKYQFDIDGQNIYSFLTNDIANTAKCLFSFDLFTNEINAVLVENIGCDSGIVIDKNNLLNTLEVSCNDNNVYTRYNVSGGNNIGIQYVNFGSTRIDDLSYFLNAKDENNKRIYVSDVLAEKYEQFVIDRNIARDFYIIFTKQYHQSLADIDEIKYRVPNDSVNNDWDKFTDSELEASLITYNQLLVTLQSLYKEDYGTVGCNSDDSINENYIKDTEYWYDYYAYQITIKQIETAIDARAGHKRYADIDDETVLKDINAYKTEWSLYGTVELQNIITTYNNRMKVLVDGEAIKLKMDSDEARTWEDLSDKEKSEYGYNEKYNSNNEESKYSSVKRDYLERYDIYMNLYNEKKSCQAYLVALNEQLDELEKVRDAAQAKRIELAKLVTIEAYDRIDLGDIVTLPSPTVSGKFSDDEIKTINLLYMDTNYSNENILTTSLDTTITEVDIQYELLQDAEEQLSIVSQPQISFTTNVDNLFCMPEFKDFDFTIGNYVTVEYYDDYYVNLRLSSMSFNPCIPENPLTISFTNFIRSKSERTDVSYILGQAVGGGSSSSSSGSGNSGSFGDSKDIDVTISNTMLAKLLNTEMFGTRVSNIILDTIKVNEITAKYAKFDGLSTGTTAIDGGCITTGYIVDKHYNGKDGNINNSEGSVINLETGEFSFGSGSLKYDGSALSVKGTIYAGKGYIGGESGFTIAVGKIYSNDHSSYNTAKDGVYIGTDCISLGSGGVTYFKCDGTGKIGDWNIDTLSIWRGSSSFGTNDGMYFGTEGLSISDVFKIDSSGNLSITDKFKVQSNGHFNFGGGKIVYNGSSLTFASDVTMSWSQITETSNVANKSDIPSDDYITTITKNTITTAYVNALKVTANSVAAENITGTTISGKSISGGSISIGSNFSVTSSGTLTANSATITGAITGTTLCAKSAVYIYDSDLDRKVKILATKGDDTSDSEYRVGRLTTNDYSSNLNYIAFKDLSQDRNIHFYSGYCEFHEPVFFDSYIDISTNSIRAADSNATIVDCSTNGAFYYGANSSYTDDSALSALRGKTVRIYSHGGGVYLGSSGSTAITSDENFKELTDIDERYEQFFYYLKPTLYKYNVGHRQHIGFGARAVENALKKSGLDTEEFAGLLIDKNVDIGKDELLSSDGHTHFDELYSLRYEEFISLNTLMLQKALSRITELEDTIKQMKG